MLRTTEAVIQRHLKAASIGLDAILSDYTDRSVLVTDAATYRGLTEIRLFFSTLLEALPRGFFDGMVLNRMEVVGEFAYIHWERTPWFPLATDTFLVRNGKILFQTFTAYAGRK